MAVEIAIEGHSLIPRQPVELFDASEYGDTDPTRSYDVRPDGERFLMSLVTRDGIRRRLEEHYGKQVKIILNWFEELKRKVPTN